MNMKLGRLWFNLYVLLIHVLLWANVH